MDITEIRVFPVHEERLKAYVTITIDNCFVVRDLKIIHGNNGLFVAMPSKKRKDGTFKDIAHPLDSETRNYMEDKILAAFEKEMEGSGMEPIPRDTPPSHLSEVKNDKQEAGNPEENYPEDFEASPNG
jgi:stage V sporulation protein G